jgi:hypothetical protein
MFSFFVKSPANRFLVLGFVRPTVARQVLA